MARVECKSGTRKFALAMKPDGSAILALYQSGAWSRLANLTPDAANAGAWRWDVSPLGQTLSTQFPAEWSRLLAWTTTNANGLSPAAAADGLPVGDDGAPTAGAPALP